MEVLIYERETSRAKLQSDASRFREKNDLWGQVAKKGSYYEKDFIVKRLSLSMGIY